MSKDDEIEVEGVVVETLPGYQFLVSVSTEGFEGIKARCVVSGKMRMHYIKIVPGDRVRLTLSPESLAAGEEDLPMGRIVFRFR